MSLISADRLSVQFLRHSDTLVASKKKYVPADEPNHPSEDVLLTLR